MPARTVRSTVVVIAVSTLLAACGASSSGGDGGTGAADASTSTPAAELASAVRTLGAAHTLNLQLSLGASGADLLQIASGLGGDAPTKPQADAIGNDHIGIQLQAAPGKTVADGGTGAAMGGAFALTLGDDSEDYFTLEAVAGALYGHIDLRYFLNLVGGSPSFNAVQRQVAGAPAFVRDAVAGKWITLSAATLKSLSGLAQGQLGATPSASKIAGLYNKMLTTLLADVAVTRSSSSGTDDLKVTFRLRELLTDEYDAIAPVISAYVPGGAEAFPPLKPKDVPDVAVTFDAFVANGALTKVVLDAGQFDTKEHISVPIDLNISQQGPTISAPSNATAIDLSSLGQLFADA